LRKVFATSAKTGEGVEEMFLEIAERLAEQGGFEYSFPEYIPSFSDWHWMKEYDRKWREPKKDARCTLQ